MKPITSVNKLAGFQDEVQLQVLRRLHQTPEVSQRRLAKELCISLGSINFCFQALVEKGWVKMQNFSRSNNKLRYVYLLTPLGVAQKSKLTAEFMERKVAEYEALQLEIESMRAEISIDKGLEVEHQA